MLLQLERRLQDSFLNEMSKADIRQALPALYQRLEPGLVEDSTGDATISPVRRSLPVRPSPVTSQPADVIHGDSVTSHGQKAIAAEEAKPAASRRGTTKRARVEEEQVIAGPSKRRKRRSSTRGSNKGKTPANPVPGRIPRSYVDLLLRLFVMFESPKLAPLETEFVTVVWT